MSADDQGPKLVTILWAVACVPVLFVAVRLYTRLILSRAYGWDDTVIVAASVSTFDLHKSKLTDD